MSEEFDPDVLRQDLEKDTRQFRHKRSDLLNKIADEYERRDNKAEAKKVRAEAAAFNLCESGNSFPGYFQPMAVFTDGTAIPPLKFFSSEVLSHLENRAQTTKNPALASRFADIVWDLAIDKNPEMARIAIDSYIGCIGVYKSNLWGGELAGVIKRAVQLAHLINDVDRLSRLKKVILHQMRELDFDLDYRFCIDIANAIAVSTKIKLAEEEVKEVEDILSRATTYYQEEHPVDESRLGPVDGPNEHFVRSFHELIIELASVGHLVSVDKTFHRIEIAKSHEREGDRAFAIKDYLKALSFYRSAEKNFTDLGLTSERDTVRMKLAKSGLRGEKQLKPVQTEFSIEFAKIEEYIKPLLADRIEEILRRIASAPHFIPDLKEASLLTEKMKKKHPLQYLVSHNILHEGHVVGSPSTEDEILHQSIIRQLVTDIHIGGIFLTYLFDKLSSEHGLDAEILTKHFENWGLCEQRNLFLMRKGFEEYFDNDYVLALHVLVPQFEDVLRNLLYKTNRPTSRPGYGALLLKSLLADEMFRDAAGNNLLRYYEVALIETTGLNLRNDLAHGLMDPGAMTKNMACIVIHLFLTLTRFRINGQES